MSKKTNPEVDDELDIDLDEDAADDLADLDDPSDEADDEPAPAKRPAKKSASTSKKAAKSTPRRGKSSSTPSAFVSGGKRPGGKAAGKSAGKGGRGHIAPVKVASDKPWGTIALFAVVGLLFVGIVGYTGYQAWYNDRTPAERANLISGVTDYSAKVKGVGDHKAGDLTYPQKPPVGGTHNGIWQNCQGDVYDKPIAEEHAVHSLEHGAIWITYQPGLPKSEVDALAKKVRNKDFMMLSPYKGQKSKISVQAWGFQLQVDSADDSRIDDFIGALRNEGPEKNATCSGGITVTGDQPREVEAPQQPGAPGGAPPGGAPQAPPGG